MYEGNKTIISDAMKNITTNIIRLSKRTAVLILLLACSSQILFAGVAWGQILNTRISISFKKSSLVSSIKKIESEYKIKFSYSSTDLGSFNVSNQTYHNETLKKILEDLLKGTNLKITEAKTSVVIHKGSALDQQTYRSDANFDFSTDNKAATKQEVLIKGVVSDKDGPMPGVLVKVEGANGRGSITGNNGSYSIKANLQAVLMFSNVGYATQKIKISSATEPINVTMVPDQTTLNEVLVVGYGTQKRSDFTGSATLVDKEAIENAPRASFLESLQGNVAGLISSSGDGVPGSMSDVTIRGLGSYSASNSPLYVIDGVAVVTGDISGYNTSAMSGLNDSDIESVTVLKDAAATAIYGSRGANGVIMITTKKGSPGRSVINFSTQGGVNQYTLTEKSKPLRTPEMLDLLREGWNNSGRNPGGFAQAVVDAGINYNVNTDWMDELTQMGSFQRYNFNVSGGNDRTKFFTSVSYFNSEGAQKGIDYDRFTGRINAENRVSDKLSFNGSFSTSFQRTNSTLRSGLAANPTRSMFRLQPWLKVYNEDGSFDYSYYIRGFNPVAIIEKNIYKANTYSNLGSLGATYKILSNLTFETKANVEFIYTDRQLFYSPEFGDGQPVNGRGVYGTTKHVNWSTTNILRYNQQFAHKQNFSVFAGYEVQRVSRNWGSAEATNFLPNTNTLANASRLDLITSSNSSNSLVSMFANSSYSFNNKYFLDATIRRDGSSRFGYNQRYATFWSAGVAWNMLQENFMKRSRLFNVLKFRGSYGVIGNQEIGDFSAMGLYQAGNDYDGNPGYIFSQYENPNLTWETARQLDVGFEFKLLKSRLSGTVDYFVRRTDGLLYNLPISSTNGVTTFIDNLGEINNKGIEVELAYKNIQAKNPREFSWETSMNFTTFRNRIVRLETSFEDQELALNSFTLAAYAGVDPNNGESLWYTNSSRTTTTNDWARAGRYVQGSALPTFYGGLTNTFGYKNFSFRFLLYFNFGNKVYDSMGAITNSDGSVGFNDIGAMPRYTYDNRWQKPGDATDVPKMMYLGTQSGLSNQTSTRFLYDGGYVRLRDVQLSYLFPSSISKKLKLTRFSTFIRANNLFTWVQDKSLRSDPEVSTRGTLDFKPPVFRTLTLGLSIQP